jgi:Helix-turn-helix domain
MSIRLINAVWKHSRQQKSGALVILLAIADYANDDGIAYPAVSTLARKARMSTRNAQRWVRTLERDGELTVLKNQGRRGVNIYRICLPSGNPDKGDAHVTTDTCGANSVTQVSSTSDSGAIQSINKSSVETTPVVPKGEDADFWTKTCFNCFEQPLHPVRPYVLRALSAAIPALNKNYAASLLEFYRTEPLHSKEPPYTSRRHSPERLILDLPRQLALAVQTCPPAPPPKRHNFTVNDVHEYLSTKYPGCYLPRSLDDLDHPSWRHIRAEVYDAMRERNRTNVDGT